MADGTNPRSRCLLERLNYGLTKVDSSSVADSTASFLQTQEFPGVNTPNTRLDQQHDPPHFVIDKKHTNDYACAA